MKRWIGVVVLVALVGGAAYWLARRRPSRSGGSGQQEQQAGGLDAQPQRGGGAGAVRAGGGEASGSRIEGLGPRGRAPDERHPRHHTAQQLRSNPIRAAGRRQELIRQIRKAGEEPAGEAGEGGEGKGEGKNVLGKEQIRTAIKAITPLAHTCYEKRLKEKEDLEGKIVIKFTIVAKDGEASLDEGEIKSSTLGDLRLDTCMLHALTKARFPVPKGEGKVTVNYPFKFRPSNRPTKK